MKWAGLRMGYRETHPNFDDAASIERLLALGFDDDSVFGEGWPALRRGEVVFRGQPDELDHDALVDSYLGQSDALLE